MEFDPRIKLQELLDAAYENGEMSDEEYEAYLNGEDA